MVDSAPAAVAAAEALGYPVALKLILPDHTHKSEIGGVQLDLRDSVELRAGAETLLARAGELAPQQRGPLVPRLLVQRFIAGGVEAIVGVSHDPTFGPLLMFGLGGVHVELMRDVVFRLHPLSEEALETMVWEPRASGLLRGYRGAPPADVEALKHLIRAVDQMVTDIGPLAEMDLNPVKLMPPGQGAVVVDARIRLQHERPAGRPSSDRSPRSRSHT